MKKPSPISDPSDYAAGTVVVVPFPYSDRLSEKRRPAVVVSVSEIERTGLLWVLMITTAKRGVTALDIPVDEPSAAGLSVACVVRPTKIACIEPSRVVRRAGSLRPSTLGIVLSRVHSLIAPPLPGP